MIFDTHAHYDDEQFNEDRVELLNSMEEQGVGTIVNVSAAYNSCRKVIALAKEYPFVYAAVGIHPDEVGSLNEETFAQMKELFKEEKVVAVGEIGLDYHYEDPPRDVQQRAFRMQMELAQKLSLPVVIHEREAHEDGLRIISDFPDVTGVFHCFSGSPEMAQELLKLGWYLGFDGPVTYKNARRAPEVAAVTPLDRMLIETDSPYMTPVPYRGKRNDSGYVRLVAEKLAEWKGVAPEEMARLTTENGKRLFRIS